jgi:threonine/homoserine/homoserine lactone efflux protein
LGVAELRMTVGSSVALFVTMVVLSFVPGPTEIAIVARSISSGVAHGLIMICGIVIADFLFIIFAVAGLAAIAEALGPLFVLVKYVAGAYLIFLGISQMCAQPATVGAAKSTDSSKLSSLLTGLFLTLGDPKAVFGYMSLLPAFVDLSRVSITDTATIMLLATVAVGSAKTCYVVLAERSVSLLESPRAKTRVNVLAGSVLSATGAFLISQGYWANQF